MKRKDWTRDELLVAFNLYCKIPFGRIHNKNPEIIKLAKLLGRTPSSISWKLANFARLDPSLINRGIKGAKHGSKAEESIWTEFYGNWENLIYESEVSLHKLGGDQLETLGIDPASSRQWETERLSITKIRVNQLFFRTAVLSAYRNTCCITGITQSELLVASHIKPWSIDVKNRVNPMNGLCLNALHDKAFDRGLISISADYKIHISTALMSEKANKYVFTNFIRFQNKKIDLPDKFLPQREFLEFHYKNIYQRA